MAKVYKSMSTIFERVKSGKIDNVVKTNKFSGITYFKRNEIIEPYLHNIDRDMLSSSMWYFIRHKMQKNKVFFDICNKINNKRVLKNLPKLSDTDLYDEMYNIYKDFPKEIVYDIFNQLNTNSYKLKYKDRTESNKNRFKFIDKANDSVLKVITNNSNIRSLVFTENIMQYYISLLVDLKLDDPEAYDDLMKDVSNTKESNDSSQKSSQASNQKQTSTDADQNQNTSDANNQKQDVQKNSNGNQELNQNSTDGNSDDQNPSKSNPQAGSEAGKSSNGQKQTSPDELLKKMLNPDGENEKLFNKVIEQAKESLNTIESVMSEEELKKHWDNLNYQKFDSGDLKQVQNTLNTIELNSDSLKPYIKKIVDKSFSYFDSKTTDVYDEFLNNPEVSEIIGYEYFHPKFKNLMIEDIQIKDSKKVGKVNVYLDISGSMCSSARIDDTSMDKLTFSKALLLKLKKMDVVNEVYTFNTKLKKLRDSNLTDVLTIDTSGGTSLNLVISDIIQKDRPSIVITDADDYINHYSEKAFLIGVAGASFHRIQKHALDQYYANNQLIVFNGDSVKKVNEKGFAIA